MYSNASTAGFVALYLHVTNKRNVTSQGDINCAYLHREGKRTLKNFNTKMSALRRLCCLLHVRRKTIQGRNLALHYHKKIFLVVRTTHNDSSRKVRTVSSMQKWIKNTITHFIFKKNVQAKH